jgi:hypothetical protein
MGVIRQPSLACGPRGGPCGTDLPIASNLPLAHATDWQFFAPGSTVGIQPTRRVRLFGRETDGSMLSDHIGYSVTYRIGPRSPETPPLATAAVSDGPRRHPDEMKI